MIAVNRNEYEKLRNFLMSSLTENITSLKTNYEKEIDSVRTLDRINNIKELIEILEKRDCISENDITLLIELANKINNTEFLTYYNIINGAAPVSAPINNNSGSSVDANIRMHEYICKSIGMKWMELARAVDIRESEIDDIRLRHDNDFKFCANEVLLLHKTNAHPRNWRLQLLEGLTTARRKDIRDHVERILNDYEI